MNNFLPAICLLGFISLSFHGCKDESTTDYKKLDALTITSVKTVSATEGNPVTFTLYFQKHSDAETVLAYEVSGSGESPVEASDLVKGLEKSSFIVPPESNSFTFSVDTIDDNFHESDEKVAVTFYAAQKIMSTGTVKNKPDNEIFLSISTESPLKAENNAAVVSLSLSKATTSEITITYSISNTSENKSVTISAGVPSYPIPITDINEEITLELKSVSGQTVNLDPDRSKITIIQ